MVRRRLSSEERNRIAKESLEFGSTQEAADHFGVSATTILNCLKESGLSRESNKTYSEEAKERIVKGVENYRTISEASRHLKVGKRTISRWLKEAGKSWKRRRNTYTEKEALSILARSNNYPTLLEASQELNVSSTTLRTWRKKYNIPRAPRAKKDERSNRSRHVKEEAPARSDREVALRGDIEEQEKSKRKQSYKKQRAPLKVNLSEDTEEGLRNMIRDGVSDRLMMRLTGLSRSQLTIAIEHLGSW